MSRPKTIITSHCQDSWYDDVGARKLYNSFRYFHPDVDIKISGDADIRAVQAKYPWTTWYTFDPVIAEQFFDAYELIVHIDADSIITGPLDELLEGDFELAGVRNNNDVGRTTNQWSIMGSPVPPGHDMTSQSLNGGLVASRSRAFWDEFREANKALGVTGPYRGNFGEQDVWNRIFWSGRYRVKVLDPKEANVYYGVSQQNGQPGVPIESAWRDLYIDGGELFCRGKKVKVIHHASGHFVPKLNYAPWVISEVKDFLDKITKG
jgi:hypothetical protein